MKKDRTSMTAIGIAVTRAVESERPAGERLIYDPFAWQFVPRWMLRATALVVSIGYAEWRGPGVMGYLIARERYIDDCLEACLIDGLQQLVILGAGYDARAYRYREQLAGARVFEVDHPATQADKLAKLVRIFGQVPQHVIFVPVDFTTQKLDDRLLESGYDPRLKTLFIWQGVTMYLTAEAVDATLAFVSKCSAEGSRVIFDYIDRSLLENRQTHAEVKGMRRYRFMTGEGLSFGLRPEEVEGYLKTLGYSQAVNVGASDLADRYCTGPGAGRKSAGGYGIATGIV